MTRLVGFLALTACIIAFALWGPAEAQPQRRVALIVANDTYGTYAPLNNPTADASLVEGALRRAGFQQADIQITRNAGFAELMRVLGEFQIRTRGADVALIYYAGHGVEADGRNWLVPVDAKLSEQSELSFQAVEADALLKATGQARARVIVLDACRDNPFLISSRQLGGVTRSLRRGLSAPSEQQTPRGSLIMLSAAPGAVANDGPAGGNSPFARAFARWIAEPGLELTFAARQISEEVYNNTRPPQLPHTVMTLSAEPLVFVPAPRRPGGDGGDPQTAAARAALASVTPAEWSAIPADRWLQRIVTPQTVGGLRILANGGNAEAQVVLATGMATKRAGLNDDMREIVSLLRTSAAQNHPRAQFEYGVVVMADLEPGRGRAEARRLFQAAAERGNGLAQYAFGAMVAAGMPSGDADLVAGARWFRSAADQGVAGAMTQLGVLHMSGQGGVPINAIEALRLFRAGAAGGDPQAYSYIARMHRDEKAGLRNDPAEIARLERLAVEGGDFVTQADRAVDVIANVNSSREERDKAIADLRRSANLGNEDARAQLGWCLLRASCAATPNVEEGMTLLRRAERSGSVDAAVYLAQIFTYGIAGQTIDQPQAVRLLQSVTGRSKTADALLSWYYYYGRGGLAANRPEAERLARSGIEGDAALAYLVMSQIELSGPNGRPRNAAEGLRLLRLASDRQIPDAQANLGALYEEGKFGLTRDPAEAVRLYRASASGGSSVGKAYLATMLMYGRGAPADTREALRLMRESADAGYGFAQATYAGWLLGGRGGPANPQEGLRYARFAAEAGNVSGYFMMGQIYLNGTAGVRHDRREAVRYLRLGARAGDVGSQQLLTRIGETW